MTTDKDGNDKVVYEEQPIGVIDGTKTTIEYDEDANVNRAVLYGYLYDEYCQDAIEILNRRGTVDCSVELCIRELSFNTANKTLQLDDFYVSGLTLLSKDVSPGMAGSNFKIEDFAVNTETVTFNTDNKLVETLEKLTNILESFDINQKSKEGGTNNKMTKFEELLTKYGKTAEDVTFDYAEMSDEELEAKFAEMLGEDLEPNMKASTKANLAWRVDCEFGATSGKFDLAKCAKKNNLDAIHDTVHEMARDEARHGRALKGMLDRYFGK